MNNICNVRELNINDKHLKKYSYPYYKNIIDKMLSLEFSFKIYNYKWITLWNKFKNNNKKSIINNFNKNKNNHLFSIILYDANWNINWLLYHFFIFIYFYSYSIFRDIICYFIYMLLLLIYLYNYSIYKITYLQLELDWINIIILIIY